MQNTISKHQEYTIFTNQEESIRVDRFLRMKLNVAQSVICKHMRKGNILINNHTSKNPNHRLKQGDAVQIKNAVITPNISVNNQGENQANAPQDKIKLIKKSIIIENKHIIAINKPCGMPTQSGSKIPYSLNTIINAIYGNEAKIIHRLDKETSGLIIIAKGREVAKELSKCLSERTIRKTYLAVVQGVPSKTKGIIESFITKSSQNKHNYDISDTEGKLAITHYEIIRTDKQKNISLIKLQPKTGRTHQLRIHCAKILHTPIIGDNKYQTERTKHKLQLFAHKIELPSNIYETEISANTPAHFIMNTNPNNENNEDIKTKK